MGKHARYAVLAVVIAAFAFTTYQVKRSEMKSPGGGG